MEKHIHHMPHFVEALMHTFVLLTVFKKRRHKEEEPDYLGDNFPLNLNLKKRH